MGQEITNNYSTVHRKFCQFLKMIFSRILIQYIKISLPLCNSQFTKKCFIICNFLQYFVTLLCSFICLIEGKSVENIHENKPTFLPSYASVRSVFQNQLLDLKSSSLPQLAETILSCVWLGCREHGVGSGCFTPFPAQDGVSGYQC